MVDQKDEGSQYDLDDQVEHDISKWVNVSGVPIFPSKTAVEDSLTLNEVVRLVRECESECKKCTGSSEGRLENASQVYLRARAYDAIRRRIVSEGSTIEQMSESAAEIETTEIPALSPELLDKVEAAGRRLAEGSGYDEALVRGVRVDDGKYRFHMKQGDYRVYVERCGEPWIEIGTGCKAVLSMMMELDEARQKLAESRGQDGLRRLAARGEKMEGDVDVLRLAREVIAAHDTNVARIAELERECNAWRDSHGPIGPRTPAEVPVFLREQARVDGQIAGFQIAKLRRAMGMAVRELEAMRWQPAAGEETWEARSGRNRACAMGALLDLRGALGGSSSASEAFELERNLHKGSSSTSLAQAVFRIREEFERIRVDREKSSEGGSIADLDSLGSVWCQLSVLNGVGVDAGRPRRAVGVLLSLLTASECER